jgi:hypothetical protein
MKAIENYKEAIENSDEKFIERGLCSSRPRRDPDWTKRQLSSEHSILYHEPDSQSRSWNKM